VDGYLPIRSSWTSELDAAGRACVPDVHDRQQPPLNMNFVGSLQTTSGIDNTRP